MIQVYATNIGQVKVGNTLLPGIFESLEITGRVKTDQVEIRGKEAKATQAVGYDPAAARLTLNLLPTYEGDDCSSQVRAIQHAFRESKEQEKPGVYRLVNRHAQARGIDEVVFSGLKTFEDNRSDKLLVICEFMEHVPVQVKVKEQTASASAEESSSETAASETVGSSYGGSVPDNFGGGKTYGGSVPTTFKTESTPAKDDRKPGLLSGVLKWLRGDDDIE
ncbi:MAG: hypothetical protein FH756_02380 [Firmicutes bacterium]|nr:hypothetical protein [Bacillota bacterium]